MSILFPIGIFNDATGGTEDTTIDVPNDGEIVALSWGVAGRGLDSLGDEVVAVFGFSSTSQAITNDSRSIIDLVRVVLNEDGTAANSHIMGINSYRTFSPDGIPVEAGERLHLISILSTGVTAEINLIVYFSFKKTSRASTRRR